MATRHRKPRPDLDEKFVPPETDDPEEALARLLHGQGAKDEDYDEDEAQEA